MQIEYSIHRLDFSDLLFQLFIVAGFHLMTQEISALLTVLLVKRHTVHRESFASLTCMHVM